ncbi:hypothetical protein MLD38_028644 [Melastoma candidum]|uniref:Uncharacterized protein n=1 Tax=Melastoma candidum TaxID=119954 RepID=A0ACB9N5Y5_9MYRT|nr:hypothetical protein MLD38_028644 [Melastoma candidum]
MAMRPNRPQASAINKVCPGQAPWLKAPGPFKAPQTPPTSFLGIMLSIPVDERIKKILCEGFQIHRYSALRTAGAIPTAHGRADRPSSLDNLAVTPTTGPVTGRMTAETREALPKALQKIFQNHKVCRKVVIDLLRGKGPNATLKKAEILRAASKVLGRSIANNEYTKVINDLSESRGSLWYLKESR